MSQDQQTMILDFANTASETARTIYFGHLRTKCAQVNSNQLLYIMSRPDTFKNDIFWCSFIFYMKSMSSKSSTLFAICVHWNLMQLCVHVHEYTIHVKFFKNLMYYARMSCDFCQCGKQSVLSKQILPKSFQFVTFVGFLWRNGAIIFFWAFLFSQWPVTSLAD